jgi:hypothetical protein
MVTRSKNDYVLFDREDLERMTLVSTRLIDIVAALERQR